MVLGAFHPAVRGWFETTLGLATPAQEQAWPAILAGEDTLVAAPTGSGKTLAAFLAVLDDLVVRRLRGEVGRGVEVVYVSPLKALSADIHVNLETPLAGIEAELARQGFGPVELTTALRTGDTPAHRRAAMAKSPPDILVTTPESLYILLTSASGRRALATTRTVIVDEIHAVAATKRGSHLSLTLERLEALAGRRVQRIGLSATQKPVLEVARFLVGAGRLDGDRPRCRIVDVGHSRERDVALEVPRSPLSAVMSHEVWGEVYERLCELVAAHRTTLVFVNTRRLAERVTHQLEERLGAGNVASHHGSLSAAVRQDAEERLRAGRLEALVATASLELGIDIGPVDLVCQVGSTRSIATFLQRIGRSGHRLGAVPKGRLFPLTRDELVESVAILDAVAAGDLDALEIPREPLDILAQQLVATVATEPWSEQALFQLVRRAYPFRDLSRERFDAVVRMLGESVTTRRGRRGALVHRDAVLGEVRGRQAARLTAVTGGGAIPDTADFKVVREPTGTVVGSVNEDFATESQAGDVFLLGNTSWRIVKLEPGVMRVEDAAGQPPSIPFWLGEAPARTRELSEHVSALVERLLPLLDDEDRARAALEAIPGVPPEAARQLVAYLGAARRALGTLPTRDRLVVERFFDESDGMQLVIHAPYGSRLNRAFGLALRKAFCRAFDFELQAAATEDAIVLSLGTRHSFPLGEVFGFLRSRTVRHVLTQALLAAPMFQSRWRWNASRALVLPRTRGGKQVPPAIQRMRAEDLVAAVFPDQIACAENLKGERQIPDHPLVAQTIDDCLHEAMDIDGLEQLLRGIESGAVATAARDLPEPSPLAHEILQARPYAFLDDAPLEERRTRAVLTRRSLDEEGARALGALDPAAIARVSAEVWPAAATADELRDALVQLGVLTRAELEAAPAWAPLAAELERTGRARWVSLDGDGEVLAGDERWPHLRALHPGAPLPGPVHARAEDALTELVAQRLEVSGPVTAAELAAPLAVAAADVEIALARLEVEGFVLRGSFRPEASGREWCERRVLARIHRLTLGRLRAEIEPVSLSDFLRFLLEWQRVMPEAQARGPDGLAAVVTLLDGYEAPAAAWERELLPARVAGYDPHWLDQLCASGRVGWGRLRPPTDGGVRAPLRTSPIALFTREKLPIHLALAPARGAPPTASARRVLEVLARRGASFYGELARGSGLLPAQVEDALAELVSAGQLTADSFLGLRALLDLSRADRGRDGRERRRLRGAGLEAAGRWSLLATEDPPDASELAEEEARLLLARYGVVFRGIAAHDGTGVPWRELARVYRRLEARGEIRGGHFVAGPSGEQFALGEAVVALRRVRREEPDREPLVLSAADPLCLVGTVLPGDRIPRTGRNRVLLVGGEPVAALVAGELVRLADPTPASPSAELADSEIERLLRGPRQRRPSLAAGALLS